MQAGQPAAGAEEFRTALSYQPGNRTFRLRLAEALLADNRLNEAAAHLKSLWEEQPADGEINLDLARLYARKNSANEAVRYYHNAINGVWPDQPRSNRIAVRFELSRYLMQQQKLPQAQAEVLALLADEPTDPAEQVELGRLLLQVNEPHPADQTFDAVLQKDRGNAQAWLGKGEALMNLGDYSAAARAFTNAAEHDPKLEEARQQLAQARELLRVAPGLRAISLAERTKRVASAFGVAIKRLKDCANQQAYSLAGLGLAAPTSAPAAKNALASDNVAGAGSAPGALQLLYTSGLQKQSSATENALKNNPDALEPTMQYVFQVELATAATCPEMDDTNRALLTLAQHESEMPK